MKASETHYDVLVIGGGTLGLAATYYTAAKGQKTACLEQYSFLNDKGSSSGESRIFRVMYADDYQTRLTESSLALWTELSKATGQELIVDSPLFFFGDKNGEPTVEGSIPAISETMTRMGVPFDRYEGAEIEAAFPTLQNIPDDYALLVQKSSGISDVQKSMKALYDLAQSKGADLIEHAQVEILDPNKNNPGNKKPYLVKTADKILSADKLILVPGAWTNSLIAPFGIEFDLSIWQMTVAFLSGQVSAQDYPLWYEFGKAKENDPGLYYGFPTFEYPDKIKASADFTYNIYKDPSELSREPDMKLANMIGKHVAHRFKGIDPIPKETTTCLYTMSADHELILDYLPGWKDVVILTGASGRGFKFTPILGRIMAELAVDGGTSYDISPLQIGQRQLLRGRS